MGEATYHCFQGGSTRPLIVRMEKLNGATARPFFLAKSHDRS